MKGIHNMKYYLSEKEFFLILSAMGMTRWFGIQLTEKFNVSSEEESHRTLAGLCEKQIIGFSDTEQIFLKEPFDLMFAVLNLAEQCILSKRAEGTEDVICHYIVQDAVVSVYGEPRQKNTLCISCMDMTSWTEYLWEDGYFPETVLGEKDEPEIVQEISDLQYCSIENFNSANVDSVFEIMQMTTGKMKKKLICCDRGECSYLYFYENGIFERFPCIRKNSEKLLKKLIDI